MLFFKKYHIFFKNLLLYGGSHHVHCYNHISPSMCREISTAIFLLSKYYDCLGIPKNATQNDIKAAYYKLSMMYHPDKNKGSDVAAEKFRDITTAYEVLGNFKLRKLYDKGIIHTAGSQYAQQDVENIMEEEDDAQTRFYKARMKKSEVPTGRTPIYDFDEWSRQHYGSSFERKKAAKARHEALEKKKRDYKLSVQNEIILFGGITLIITILFIISTIEARYMDSNKIIEKDESKS